MPVANNSKKNPKKPKNRSAKRSTKRRRQRITFVPGMIARPVDRYFVDLLIKVMKAAIAALSETSI
jgi:hypothetical protein